MSRIAVLAEEADSLGQQLMARKDVWAIYAVMMVLWILQLRGILPTPTELSDWGHGHQLIIAIGGVFAIAIGTSFGIPILLLGVGIGLSVSPYIGAPVMFIGIYLATVIQLSLARRRPLQPSERLTRLVEQIGHRGMMRVALLRITPGVPFVPLNYLAGALNVNHRSWTIGSTIGSIPRIASYLLIGGSLTNLTWNIAWQLGLIVLGTLGIVGVVHWSDTRVVNENDGESDPDLVSS